MYMKKLVQAFLPVIRGFLVCAAALQIVLGIIYIGKNFMAVPQFRDTTIYLEMSERFVVDEYTGILYPLLVKLCKSISFLPYQIPIYILQLFAGVYSVYHFVRTWTEQKVPAFVCALWLNTIPFVAQAHVTVLPHSLAMTCLILMSLQVLKGSVQRRRLTIMEWAELWCSFIILAQLDRAYLLPGMLFAVWAAFLQFYNTTHRVLLFGISLLIGIGMLIVNLAIYDAVQKPGYYGRIQRTASSSFFQRTGVVTLKGKYRIYMPEEVQDSFTWEELDQISKYPYKIQNEFGPTLEARFGQEWAEEIYFALGMLGLATATKDNAVNIAEDVASYVLPLGAYATWQDGELKGATSWNYQQFIHEAPTLSVYYAKICSFLWSILFGISLAICFVLGVCRKRWYVRIWLPAIGCVLIYAVYFAMSGTDVYDYKVALLPMVMSCAPICYLAFRYIFKED